MIGRDTCLSTYLPEFQHWSIFLSSLKGRFIVPGGEGAGSGLRLCDCGLWRHWGFHMHWHSSSRSRASLFLSLCGRFWHRRCCSRSRGMKPMTWPLSPRGTDKVANKKIGEEKNVERKNLEMSVKNKYSLERAINTTYLNLSNPLRSPRNMCINVWPLKS